jgi:hypothetical protein
MKYCKNAFLMILCLFWGACQVKVSQLKPVIDNAQNKHSFDNLQLEFIETRAASQVGSAIVISDLLLEAKSKHGNVTITNLREQTKRQSGKTTYYVIYDIVKVKNK